MEPAAPETLLKAFQTLDADGKGYISKDHMTKLMTEEGDPFTQVCIVSQSLTCLVGMMGQAQCPFSY